MIVRLFGLAGERRLERRWTLIAEQGDGPEIPTLAMLPVVELIARGAAQPGARDAGGLLALEDFDAGFAGLAVAQEIVERALPPTLYRRVMGKTFDALPPSLRRLHALLRDDGARGIGEAERGRGLAGVFARLLLFPPPGSHVLHVAFAEREGRETWTRDFGGHVFASILALHGDLIVERFGLLRFGFSLPGGPQGLEMVLRRWWLGPLPMPLALAPRIAAREWEEGGRFRFHVAVRLPWLGLLFAYRGWLEPAPGPEPLDARPDAA